MTTSPQFPPPIEILRDQIVSDMDSDRRSWRLTEVPQLVIMIILLIAMASVVTFGLYSAIFAMKQADPSKQTLKFIQLFVGGSSSLLGFIVLKLSVRISDLTKRFMVETKRFTSDINRIRLCTTTTEIEAILKGYFKTGK